MTDWKQEIKGKTFQAFDRHFGFRPTRGHEDQFLLDNALNLAEEKLTGFDEMPDNMRIMNLPTVKELMQQVMDKEEEITRLKDIIDTRINHYEVKISKYNQVPNELRHTLIELKLLKKEADEG